MFSSASTGKLRAGLSKLSFCSPQLKMSNLEIPSPDVEAMPAADMQATKEEQPSDIVHQSYPVKRPEREIEDFVIPLRASRIGRCRSNLENWSDKKFFHMSCFWL
jgi:hypothetical protein